MIPYWAVTGFWIIALICAAAFAFERVRKATISGAVAIWKETDNQRGEHVTFQANYSIFDSKEKIQAKIAKLYDLGDERKLFVHDRFVQAIEQAQAEQQAAAKSGKGNLKPVG